MSMLKFSQMVLAKVSFDESLFEKELRKAVDRLMSEEVEALKNWCYSQFPQLRQVLNNCFTVNTMTFA